ncbi:hypothetical protein ACVWW1_004040 [Bradyrhizobium sp. JR3.5]
MTWTGLCALSVGTGVKPTTRTKKKTPVGSGRFR